MPRLVNDAATKVRRQAAASGMSFRLAGASLDANASAGVEHLAAIARFDEVSAGYGWANGLALQHVWHGERSVPKTPQLIIYRRRIQVPLDTLGTGGYREIDRIELMRIVGLDDITEWVTEGAILNLPDEEGSQTMAVEEMRARTLQVH